MNLCNVSIFKNATDVFNASQASIGALFECIRTGGSIKGLIEEIRQYPITSKKRKLELPVIMWQGAFSHRADNGLRNLSSLMCIDIDHQTPEKLMMLRSCLMNTSWVMAMFRSPSGDGLKVIVKTDNYAPSKYKNLYRQLEKMFEDRFAIKPDKNCEALSQGCFASYDPDIYVNQNPQTLHLEYDPAYDDKPKATQATTSANTYSPQPLSRVAMFLSQLGNGLSDDDIIEIADKRFQRYPNRYKDGYRTKSIFVQASALCKAGIPIGKALDYLKEHYLPTGYDEDKLEYEACRAYEKNKDLYGTERSSYRP